MYYNFTLITDQIKKKQVELQQKYDDKNKELDKARYSVLAVMRE